MDNITPHSNVFALW